MEIPYRLTLSYVDDFAITVLSHCYRRNVQLLQGQYAILKAKVSPLGGSFSVPKTELIHWSTSWDKDPHLAAPMHLDGRVFHARSQLRWLRLCFTPSLATSPHFTKWLAKAQAALMAIKPLSPTGVGLPPYLCHRLAASLLFAILSYGADIFYPTVHMTSKQAVFWPHVQRWCTNCLACTQTDILAIEACLPPLDLLLAYKTRLATLQVLCFPPDINPATVRLAPSVQTPSLLRIAPDHRTPLVRNAGSRLPLPSLQLRPPTKNRANLLFDAVPHSMLFLLGPNGLAPLQVTSGRLLAELYPEPSEGGRYPQLRWRCLDLLIEQWKARARSWLITLTPPCSQLTPLWVLTSSTWEGSIRQDLEKANSTPTRAGIRITLQPAPGASAKIIICVLSVPCIRRSGRSER